MPKVTEAYLKTRRQQILDAAIACFARKGFHQTTMEDIGDEAGLSPGVAYRYFESKDDIIVATVQGSLDRSADFFEEASEEEDIQSLLEQMIDDTYQRFEQPDRDIYYKVRVQLWAETLQNKKVAESAGILRDKGQMQLAAIIRRGQELGQIKSDLDGLAVALAIMANHDGFILHWLANPHVDIRKYREATMEMVRGLFTDK
jgi:AcrR family transcriptional regulator